MALSFAHGAIQWLAADAATTTYTVSGLSFQPKALRFYWQGLQSATDSAPAFNTASIRRGVGFAVDTSNRRCVGTFSEANAGNANCGSFAANDCVVGTVDGSGARDGELDLNSITSDGFTLIVDDQGVANITVFWEAWGGSDITVAAVVDIAEPAATGNQDYTVTGFASGGTDDQVVMFAGVQSVSALNTGEAQDSGLHVGFAASTTAGDNVTLCGNSDDGSATMDTDGYCQSGECISMIVIGGGTSVNARATLTTWNTNGFRLNWAARATTSRRTIALAIKGGRWKSGEYTINTGVGGNTATVSGLSFAPVGLSLISRSAVESTAATAGTEDNMTLGSASSTSSRRSMGAQDLDAQATSAIYHRLSYDQVLTENYTGNVVEEDVNAFNSDGFQTIIDVPAASITAWRGYLTFGSAVASGAIAGTTTMTFAPTATLTGSGALAGVSTVAFAPAGAMTGAAPILGSTTFAFAPTGTMQSLGVLAGNSTMAFAPSGTLVGAGALLGSTTIVFTPTATLVGAGALLGTSTMAFAPSAALVGAAPIAGSLTIAFAPTGTMLAIADLAGSVTMTFTPTGVMLGAGAMAGTSTMTFTGTATLSADGALLGSGTMTFTVTGTLDQPSGALQGSSTMAFAPSGTMLGDGAMAGVSTMAFNPTATLLANGAMLGTTTMAFAPAGALSADGALLGSSTLTFTPQAALDGSGALAGQSIMAFTVTGTFDGGAPVVDLVVFAPFMVNIGTFMNR